MNLAAAIQAKNERGSIDIESARWTSAMTPDFKRMHQFADYVMVQVDVPMRRYAEYDLIRIDGCPEDFTKDDCKDIETLLKELKLGAAAADLAIRKYLDSARGEHFLIVFVGNCQRRSYLVKLFTQEGITLRRKGGNIKLKIREQKENVDRL